MTGPKRDTRPLTQRQERTLLMMPVVYRWTSGSLPSLLRRGLVARDRVSDHGRARWRWSLTPAGQVEAARVRAAARAVRGVTDD